jgi:signal transduction histidine kinase/ActR/RegA family two-component response regulator
MDLDGRLKLEGPNLIADTTRYIISDFRTAPGYGDRPYVTGFPHMVSYLEVPLLSPLGYIVGSYCVVDNKLRQFNDDSVVKIMGDIATSIMTHLESVNTKRREARATRLIEGLSNYAEGRAPPYLKQHSILNSKSESAKVFSASSVGTENTLNNGIIYHEVLKSKTETTQLSIRTSNRVDDTVEKEATHSVMTYSVHESKHETSKASVKISNGNEGSLLNELEHKKLLQSDKLLVEQPPIPPTIQPIPEVLDQSNSIVDTTSSPHTVDDILNSNSSLGTMVSADQNSVKLNQSKSTNPLQDSKSSRRAGHLTILNNAARTIREAMDLDGLLFLDAAPNVESFPNRGDAFTTPMDQSEVLAQSFASLQKDGTLHVSNPHGHLSGAVVNRLIHQSPKGRVFSADESGLIDRRFDPGVKINRSDTSKSTVDQEDESNILSFLPEARYILFLPLWHFQRECWFAVMVGWVTDPSQAMDIKDLHLLTAFGNSVVTEITYSEAETMSRIKSDFISSISHELRSPLHGILATSELIREYTSDTSFISMVDMIQCSGTTLLHTLNNLLDHAKINNFTISSRKQGTKIVGYEAEKDEMGLALVDLSRLVEEVVETVILGHTSMAATQNLFPRENNSSDISTSSPEQDIIHQTVLVTLDIEKRSEWLLKVDPGAWNRIIMNLFGNALKYTKAGFIEVSLKLVPSSDIDGASHGQISFSVRDSGIGMSPEYLKYHLFKPFSQENSTSQGTGLGLSIVQQLTHNLGGKVEVRSQKGVGTVINVLVPFSTHTTGVKSPMTTNQEPQIDYLFQQSKRLCIIFPDLDRDFHGFLSETGLRAAYHRSEVLCETLKKTAEEHFGMTVTSVKAGEPIPKSDIYFYDSQTLHDVMEHDQVNLINEKLSEIPSLIVLFPGAGPIMIPENLPGTVIPLRHPLGPRKLATVFRRALDGNNVLISSDLVKVSELNLPRTVDYKAAKKLQIRQNSYFPLFEETKSEQSPSTLQNSRPLHLLLVDDNGINLKLLVSLMKKLNHTFETASNGMEAVLLYQTSLQQESNFFDFVFMDISMPVMDGFEATRRIRKLEREGGFSHCEIVALTGLGSEAAQQEAVDCGIDLFLRKPVKLVQIKELLNQKGAL